MKEKNKSIIILIIIMCVMLVLVATKDYYIQFLYPRKYSEYVPKYAKEYGLDEELIYAVIKAESNFNANAKSSKNAIGLMQLMKSTAKDIVEKIDNLNISDDELEEKLQEPDININLGAKYLSILIEKYQNIELSITAYNAGIGTVDNWIEKGILKSDGSDIENIPYKETNNYVRKILRDYKIYKNYYSTVTT